MISTDRLYELTQSYGIPLDSAVLEHFDLFAELLVEWNQKFNLTAITDPEEIVIKHFVDSLLCLKTISFSEGARVIDIGTGAGFPAIPLLIARPDLKMTMLDSNRKKVSFLEMILQELQLHGEVFHSRAEEMGQSDVSRETFDVAVARAVSHLRELSEYCLPFVKVGGIFLAMKGPNVQQELEEAGRAIQEMGGKVRNINKVILPNDSIRNLVIVEKISQTPSIYPRPSAKIAKKPIESR